MTKKDLEKLVRASNKLSYLESLISSLKGQNNMEICREFASLKSYSHPVYNLDSVGIDALITCYSQEVEKIKQDLGLES